MAGNDHKVFIEQGQGITQRAAFAAFAGFAASAASAACACARDRRELFRGVGVTGLSAQTASEQGVPMQKI